MDGSQLAQYPDIKPDHRLMIVARYEMITTHKIQASDAAQDIHGLKVQLGSLLKEVNDKIFDILQNGGVKAASMSSL